jgi:phage-related protein
VEFPRLKTAAVQQYGSSVSSRFETRVLRFVDGKEQRFPVQKGAGKSWVLRYSQLTEGELAALDDFFQAMQGPAQEFVFEDPRTGIRHERCRLSGEKLALQLDAEHGGNAEIEIVEVTD